MPRSKVVNFFGVFNRRTSRTSGVTRHADIIDITTKLRANYKAPTRKGVRTVLVDVVEADFRTSDRTIFNSYMRACVKSDYTWKENHTFLAISMNKKLAMWFVGETKINGSVVLDTRKWRITGNEQWDLENIQFYAAQVGLDLVLPSTETIEGFRKYAA